jgi:hypothetical protein
MARRTPDQNRIFRALIDKLTPELRRAFLAAVDDLKAGIDWTALLSALRRRDIEGAVDALNIEAAAWEKYRSGKTRAYEEGGQAAVATVNLDGLSASIRFDMTNWRAEAWVREHVGRKITLLAEEQKDIARKVIGTGYAAGQHPNGIAVELAGRIVAGKRQGGVLGLSGPFADHVLTMRARLASGDPKEMAKVLKMARRDKRFDRAIVKAIEAGKRPAQADIDKMVQRYADRLLDLRAKTVARTETGQAVMAARLEEWRQVLDKIGAPASAVVKTWVHGGGPSDPRPWHVAANGMEVRGLDTPFLLASGASMLCAHDPSAPASEVANCTCGTNFRLDHSWRR